MLEPISEPSPEPFQYAPAELDIEITNRIEIFYEDTMHDEISEDYGRAMKSCYVTANYVTKSWLPLILSSTEATMREIR